MRVVLTKDDLEDWVLYDIKCVDARGREYPVRIVVREKGYSELEVPDSLLDKIIICRLVLTEKMKLPKKVLFKTIRLL